MSPAHAKRGRCREAYSLAKELHHVDLALAGPRGQSRDIARGLVEQAVAPQARPAARRQPARAVRAAGRA